MAEYRFDRRQFLKITGGSAVGWYVATQVGWVQKALAAIPGGTLDPADVTKYATRLLIPPVMPRAGTIKTMSGKNADYYEISMKQVTQQILPAGLPATTVWGYGAVKGTGMNPLLIHNAPSLTIEAQANRPVRIKWINDLKDANGDFLPHLLARVRSALGEEIARALKEGFTPEEVASARRALLEERRANRAQDRIVAGALAQQAHLGRTFAESARIDAAIEAADAASLNAALRKHLTPEKIAWAFAGDFAKK